MSNANRVKTAIVTLLCLKAPSSFETILMIMVTNTLAYYSTEMAHLYNVYGILILMKRARLASTADRVKTAIVTLLCLKGANNFENKNDKHSNLLQFRDGSFV